MTDLPTESEPVTVVEGDCLDVLRAMPDGCVDAVVTDPPYGLVEPRSGGDGKGKAFAHRTEEMKASRRGGFMGKAWDAEVPGVPFWSAVLRVLKPGGHMLAMGGTRTYHRLACAVEDAGFEIRDSIMFMHSKPFDLLCNCDVADSGGAVSYIHEQSEPGAERNVRPVRGGNVSSAVNAGGKCGEVLQSGLPEQDAPGSRTQTIGRAGGGEQPGVEGRGDVPSPTGELRQRQVCEVSAAPTGDGEAGRVCDGTPAGDGGVAGSLPDPNGGCASHRPRPVEQRGRQPGTVAGQPGPQARGVGTICDRCGKPTVMPPGWEGVFPSYLAWVQGQGFPKGQGCLKPAWEPILLCRKPGPKVLPLGIDECRVGDGSDRTTGGTSGQMGGNFSDDSYAWAANQPRPTGGRWPANVVHDGSDEVMEAFAAFGERRAGAQPAKRSGIGYMGGGSGTAGERVVFDAGTAARFFYCAKSSRAERGDGNAHPTVKPLALMRWLVKLVCPPGGLVLDPFAGSGTTGVAAVAEGRRAVLVEKEPAYADTCRKRIAEAMGTGLLAVGT